MAEQPSQQQFYAGYGYGNQQNPHYEQLRAFWQEQLREIEQVPSDPAEFKNHQLPLARIKKIMKSDEDVRMISAEAPVLFAKACEMFILELTLRSWYHAEENKRRTLQRNDIAAAIMRTDIFDFLVDIVPPEERKPGGEGDAGALGGAGGSGSNAGASAAGGAGAAGSGVMQGAPGMQGMQGAGGGPGGQMGGPMGMGYPGMGMGMGGMGMGYPGQAPGMMPGMMMPGMMPGMGMPGGWPGSMPGGGANDGTS